MIDWDINPGECLSREERRKRFGGATQGGIEPSAQTPNVFIYSDPNRGESNGYIYDGWNEERSVFLYTGEGRNGDQRLLAGNKAIVEHKNDGRTLRLFVADGFVPGTKTKNQRYLGEFEIDDELPYYMAEAPNADDPELRSVYVFRLRPVGPVEIRSEDLSPKLERPTGVASGLVSAEGFEVTSFERNGTEASTALRVESGLVGRYTKHLEALGHQVKRWKLAPPDEINFLYTDIFDITENELYEAKGSAIRSSVRLAVGQLLDYRRLLPQGDVKLTLLLPVEPSRDLKNFIKSCGMSCVWEVGHGEFHRIAEDL